MTLRPAHGFAARRSKYGAVRTEIDGVSFASKKEAARYSALRLLERAGEIAELRRQVRFPLMVNGKVVGHVVPDFVYRERGQVVCEDVKSEATITPMFKWKAKHFAAQYGFEIRVVQ